MCISCHELYFEADWSKGADTAKKNASNDLFFAEVLICGLQTSKGVQHQNIRTRVGIKFWFMV